MQAAADLTYDKNAQEWRVLEVKIEVLWGRPYLGILFPQSAGARYGCLTCVANSVIAPKRWR